MLFVFFFKQKTAYEMRISDWSSDVCSSDLGELAAGRPGADPQYRIGLGARTVQARRALLSLHPDQGTEYELGDLGRPDRGAVERSRRPAPARSYRPRPRGGRGRIALARPVGRRDRKRPRLNSSH